MPLTVGTDTYVSLEDANAYFVSVLHVPDAWIDANDGVKEAALRAATSVMQLLGGWRGAVVSRTQALAFPRTGVYDRQGRYRGDMIPPDIERACTELAAHLIANHPSKRPANGVTVTEKRVGDLQLKYSGTQMDPLPDLVRRLVEPYLTMGSPYNARVLL